MDFDPPQAAHGLVADLDDTREKLKKAEAAYSEQYRHAQRLVLERNKVYQERNCLLAALSKLWIECDDPSNAGRWKAWLSHHPDDPKWDPEWLTIVYFDSPLTGQMSWHIHDVEVPMFAHLSWGDNTWDGHTTEQKYARLGKL